MRTMMIVVATAALSLLLGCAQRAAAPPPSSPRQYEGPPPAAPADPSPGPAAAGANLQMSLPAGWGQLPPERVPTGLTGMLVNPSTGAMILVMVETSTTTPLAAVAEGLRADFVASGITCSPVTASADGLTATFTTAKDAMRGKIAFRRLTSGSTGIDLGLMGRWTDASDTAMTADFDAVAASASLGAAPPASSASPSIINLTVH